LSLITVTPAFSENSLQGLFSILMYVVSTILHR